MSHYSEPWLTIDPKPLAAEREFGLAPIVRSKELGHSRELVLARLDRLADALRLDRWRARGWAFGQTLAWAFEGSTVIARHVETARCCMRRGERPGGERLPPRIAPAAMRHAD